MKVALVKFHIVIAQIIPFIVILEMVVLHSIWAAIIAFPTIFSLGFYRCQNCKTPLWDKRIMGTMLPVSPNIIDKCKVCGERMIG